MHPLSIRHELQWELVMSQLKTFCSPAQHKHQLQSVCQSGCLSLPAQLAGNSLNILVNAPALFIYENDQDKSLAEKTAPKFGSRVMPGGFYESVRNLLDVCQTCFTNFLTGRNCG